VVTQRSAGEVVCNPRGSQLSVGMVESEACGSIVLTGWITFVPAASLLPAGAEAGVPQFYRPALGQGCCFLGQDERHQKACPPCASDLKSGSSVKSELRSGNERPRARDAGGSAAFTPLHRWSTSEVRTPQAMRKLKRRERPRSVGLGTGSWV